MLKLLRVLEFKRRVVGNLILTNRNREDAKKLKKSSARLPGKSSPRNITRSLQGREHSLKK
jgi:hypothetical protein